MDRVSISKLTILAGILGTMVATPSQCEAGPLLDWLTGKKRNAAQTVYSPTTTMTAATAANTAANGSCCGPGHCEQTVLRYVPQVAYRTVWQPVPVTTYRRTVSYSPETGLPLTCTQPCTTYQYQARRVPYTTFRPTYAQVPVTTNGNCGTRQVPVSTMAAALPNSSCGCNGSSPATGFSSTAPYYSTPGSTGLPATGIPNTGSAANGINPRGATPWERVDSAPAAGGLDPADRVPMIEPDPAGSNPRSSLRRIPSITLDDVGDDYREADMRYDDGRKSVIRNRNSGTGSDGYYRDSSEWTRVDPNARRDDWDAPNFSRQRGVTRRSTMERDLTAERDLMRAPRRETKPSYDLRPLPNLDSPSNSSRFDSSAPRLLNDPRDNTASLIRPIPTRWASNRIAWPDRQVDYELDMHRGSTRGTQPSATRRLDSRRAPPVARPERDEPLHRFDSDSQKSTPWNDGWRSAHR